MRLRGFVNLAGVLLVVLPAAGATRYVNGTCGNDTWSGADPNCTAPNGPKRSIQAAIAAAASGDTILIADGIYTGAGNRGLDFSGKNLIVRSAGDPNACIIDCESAARAFYLHSGETAAARIEGLTIRNGRTAGSGDASTGGGVLCKNASPVISNCIIKNCRAGENGGGIGLVDSNARIELSAITDNVGEPYGSTGGGIYCSGGQPLITQCTIARNQTDQWDGGGGIFASGGTVITFCHLEANSGYRGSALVGGALLADSTVVNNTEFQTPAVWGTQHVLRCTIQRNTAGVGGVALVESCVISDHGGGGVFGNPYGEPISVINSVIERNYAYYGGGVYDRDGGIAALIGCTIRNNSAEFGGGLYLEDCNAHVEGCTFEGNIARQNGGGVYTDCVPEFTGCTFVRNFVGGSGGGLYCVGDGPPLTNCGFFQNRALGKGGAVAATGWATPVLTNCNLVANRAGLGGGLHAGQSLPLLTNTIVWDNTAPLGPQLAAESNAWIILSHSHVRDGLAAAYATPDSFIDWTADCSAADPLLTGDGRHVAAGSPCIDAGDAAFAPAVDVDSEPRGPAVDIGLDEFRDQDTDGLPDWWEFLHFGTPLVSDPLDNPDGDARDNAAEYSGGYNPLRPPTTVHVAPSGNDAWNGLCATHDGLTCGPKATIQAAIDAADAREGDTVLIAPGTYTGAGNRDLLFRGKEIVVRGADPNDDAVVAATIINCAASSSDRHRGFDFNGLEGPGSVLAGVTIRNAVAPDWTPVDVTSSAPRGGGVLCRWSSPTISRCRFESNNGYGGGIYCHTTEASISGCTFTSNSGLTGASVHIYRGSPVISACLFQSNAGTYGSGVYAQYGAAHVVDCDFISNTGNGLNANSVEGMVIEHSLFQSNTSSSDGAGLTLSGVVLVSECVIQGNQRSATGKGGGISISGENVQIEGCQIIGNKACKGGGISAEYGNARLRDCLIQGNQTVQCSPQYGGAIFGKTTAVNCVFVSNQSTDGGAGYSSATSQYINCRFENNTANGSGGAIFGPADVVGCLFKGNSAYRGGAIDGQAVAINCTFHANNASIRGGAGNLGSPSALTNCVAWGNTSPSGSQFALKNSTQLSVNYSIIQNGAAGIFLDSGAAVVWGTGNSTADPRFVAAGTNYEPRMNSPCIDAGSVLALPPDTFDLDNDGDLTETIPFDVFGKVRRFDDPLRPDAGDGPPPAVDIGAVESILDCDDNGVLDSIDLADCPPGTPDCQDCDASGLLDSCDLAAGAPDCNQNAHLDSCEIAAGLPDCNVNGIPDECDLASGQFDCDNNGLVDWCETIGGANDCNGNHIPDVCDMAGGANDCNGNGILDVCDVAAGAPDCNSNQRPDDCDIADGTAQDCDDNGIPDSCQVVLAPAAGESSQLSPIGTGFTQRWRMAMPPPAASTVVITVTAAGDLSATNEYLTIWLNAQNLGNVFQTGATDCPAVPNVATLSIPTATYNAALAGGGALFRITTTSAVNPYQCNPPSYARISVSYQTNSLDCNGNGVPDECDIGSGLSPDANNNSVPDECELIADFDNDGDVDGDDLERFGQCQSTPNTVGCFDSDADADGVVDLVDFAALQATLGLAP